MKILIIQLARFGDIYQSWPTIRAVGRKHPAAEIHVLVRQKFASGLVGLGPNFIFHQMPTPDILSPLLEVNEDVEESIDRLENWLKPLQTTDWSQIINLSFSPVSSYLTEILSGLGTEVRGYTRFEDGFLSIPDDSSAYFYAQVGPGRHNRFHLVDLFAFVAQVELNECDFGFRGTLEESPMTSPYVVIHLGASQQEKCYPIDKWAEVIRALDFPVCLVGSANEKSLAEPIDRFPNVFNLIGQTTLPQLFSVLKNARLLIGADSAPIHMASHIGTPVLNLSFGYVNFWETGPFSKGSYVIKGDLPSRVGPDEVVRAAHSILAGETPLRCIGVDAHDSVRFTETKSSFEWNLIKSLYTEGEFPELDEDADTESGLLRLIETSELALEQLSILKRDPQSSASNEILSSIDLILDQIPKLAPQLAPLLSWFQTERIRIGPGSLEVILARTEKLFHDLFNIGLALLQKTSDAHTEWSLRQLKLDIVDCAQKFRQFKVAQAEPKLQRFLNRIALFDRRDEHRPMVQSLSKFLPGLAKAIEMKNYLVAADLLEFEIANQVAPTQL